MSLRLAVLGEKLYAIGGHVGGISIASVECLDLATSNGKWTPAAPMTMPRRGFGAVVTDGKIYAIGGHGTEDSMECFDPMEGPQGRWTQIDSPLKFPRGAATAEPRTARAAGRRAGARVVN